MNGIHNRNAYLVVYRNNLQDSEVIILQKQLKKIFSKWQVVEIGTLKIRNNYRYYNLESGVSEGKERLMLESTLNLLVKNGIFVLERKGNRNFGLKRSKRIKKFQGTSSRLIGVE